MRRRPAAEPSAPADAGRFTTGTTWALVGIVVVSLAASTAGISSSAPSVWNPDELVYRVKHAIVTGYDGFVDRTNFDYPSLPTYVSYGLGWLVYAAGGLAFRARADAPRTLAVAVGQLGFTATDRTSNARLYFPAAGHPTAVELADVRLQKSS